MKLEDFVKVIENADRLRIFKDEKEVYVGFLALLVPIHGQGGNEVYECIRNGEIKKFRAVPEIRHKKWEELNLMRPLQPEETPEFSFSDLQMSLYYTFYL